MLCEMKDLSILGGRPHRYCVDAKPELLCGELAAGDVDVAVTPIREHRPEAIAADSTPSVVRRRGAG